MINKFHHSVFCLDFYHFCCHSVLLFVHLLSFCKMCKNNKEWTTKVTERQQRNEIRDVKLEHMRKQIGEQQHKREVRNNGKGLYPAEDKL